MKRCFTVLLSAALCIALLVACGRAAQSPEVRQLEVERVTLASSPAELQEVSDLIVVFTPEDSETVLNHSEDGNVSGGYTKTEGRVSRVLKGALGDGDTITVTEECYTSEDGSVLWTQGGYLPMHQNQAYLLFLTAYEDGSDYAGMYFPTDLEYGRYVLLPSGAAEDPSHGIFELGEAGDLATYTQWYQEIEALYPELF